MNRRLHTQAGVVAGLTVAMQVLMRTHNDRPALAAQLDTVLGAIAAQLRATGRQEDFIVALTTTLNALRESAGDPAPSPAASTEAAALLARLMSPPQGPEQAD